MRSKQQAKYILIYTLITFSHGISKAQEFPVSGYTSEKLQYIAEKLYEDYQIDCSCSTIGEVDDLAIITRKTPSEKVFHIGFNLFSDEITDKHASPAYRFIERYLLDLYLLKEELIIARQMKEDKVQFNFGSTIRKSRLREQLANLIPMLNKSRSFSISTENNTYTIAYTNDQEKVFEVRFPADYQLLSGMNKKECEQFFYTSLLSFPDERNETETVDFQHSLEKIGRDCYVQKGETYQIDAMNSNRYYTPHGRTYKQLSDTAHAEESIHNLFTIQADRRIEADITLRLYGQKKIDFSMPLHKLLEFCKANGCKIFAGIESTDAYSVKGTAILLNQTHGYSHTLKFEVNPKVLNLPEEYKVKVNLYIFSPIHNIESLFFDNNNKQ